MGWLIDKTLLKWQEPAEAWRIIENRQLPKNGIIIDFATWFIISMLVMLSLAIFKRYPYGTPFTLAQIISVSILIAIFLAKANRRMMRSPSTIKITENGITRNRRGRYSSNPATWEYETIHSYYFDTIAGDSKTFKILVLRSREDQIWKIGLDDSMDIAALESILADKGIFKSHPQVSV